MLCSAGAVVPGGTARITVSLANEDDQPVQVTFFGTGLVGDSGELIPVECLSFEPRELAIGAREDGSVEASVAVPAHIPRGIYSGLIRASELEELHAVLVIHVVESWSSVVI